MIALISRQEVLQGCRKALGIELEIGGNLDDQLLAGLIRRCAGINCPCSKAKLRSSIMECLKALSDDEVKLKDRVESAIEGLILGGDLQEINERVSENTNQKGTWIYTSPPCFINRGNGNFYILGIVPDHDNFLTSSLTDQIIYDGYIRSIQSNSGQNIAHELNEQGLQELSEKAWLKCPRWESAKSLIDRYSKKLLANSPSGSINELIILDSEKPVNFYTGRWTEPTNKTGIYIARRPQEYGAAIWCLVKLNKGVPSHLLDLPLERSRWRGCDRAWHIQMAIDYNRDTPQKYRRTLYNEEIRLDFFSPLPLWFVRRLMIFGRSVPKEKCLFSYMLPCKEAEKEEQYLQKSLWVLPTSDYT
ncbi:MAG: hypothetical protein OXF46_08595 [Rhodobacteraceae bacterium]|nr:hypothetical protein [Paracoccaceae bacterium]